MTGRQDLPAWKQRALNREIDRGMRPAKDRVGRPFWRWRA